MRWLAAGARARARTGAKLIGAGVQCLVHALPLASYVVFSLEEATSPVSPQAAAAPPQSAAAVQQPAVQPAQVAVWLMFILWWYCWGRPRGDEGRWLALFAARRCC